MELQSGIKAGQNQIGYEYDFELQPITDIKINWENDL
jgi:hypothetical protein